MRGFPPFPNKKEQRAQKGETWVGKEEGPNKNVAARKKPPPWGRVSKKQEVFDRGKKLETKGNAGQGRKRNRKKKG